MPVAVKERLAKYAEYKAYFYYFFTDSLAEMTRRWILTHNGSKHAFWRKEVHFLGAQRRADNILGFKFPKNDLVLACSSVRVRNQDEWRHKDWRHSRRSVARSPPSVERRILFIAFWELLRFCILQWLSTIFGTINSVFAKCIHHL